MAIATSNSEHERLLEFYGAIERSSREMLCAARLADWPRVCSIYESCGHVVSDIRRLNAKVVLSRDERKAKLRVMRQIIRNEAQIRRLASPWSDRYEHLLLGKPLALPSIGHEL